jgi:hypothetical protein
MKKELNKKTEGQNVTKVGVLAVRRIGSEATKGGI